MKQQQGGPLSRPTTLAVAASSPQTDDSITDRPVSLRVGHRERQVRRLADQLMPMSRYYGPQPLLAIPLGELYVRGRWAA